VSYTYHNPDVGLQDDSIYSYLVWDDGSYVQSFYGAKIIRFRQPHTQFPTNRVELCVLYGGYGNGGRIFGSLEYWMHCGTGHLCCHVTKRDVRCVSDLCSLYIGYRKAGATYKP
jgi:hypothetical protein